MLDIILLIYFIVMAIRIAIGVFKERHILKEFDQSISLAIDSLLFPLGIIALLALPNRLGWLPAVLIALLCYLPAFIISRGQSKALEYSGTDRTRKARDVVTQAFVTSIVGFAYIVLFLFLIYISNYFSEFGT